MRKAEGCALRILPSMATQSGIFPSGISWTGPLWALILPRGGVACVGACCTRGCNMQARRTDRKWSVFSETDHFRRIVRFTMTHCKPYDSGSSARKARNWPKGIPGRKGTFLTFMSGTSIPGRLMQHVLEGHAGISGTSTFRTFCAFWQKPSLAIGRGLEFMEFHRIPWIPTLRTTPYVCPPRPPLRTCTTPPTCVHLHHRAYCWHRWHRSTAVQCIKNPWYESWILDDPWIPDLRYEVSKPQIWGSKTLDMRTLDLRYEALRSRLWGFWTSDMRSADLRYEVPGPRIWGIRTSDMRSLSLGYEVFEPQIWGPWTMNMRLLDLRYEVPGLGYEVFGPRIWDPGPRIWGIWTSDMRIWISDMRYMDLVYEVYVPQIWGPRTSDMRSLNLGYEVFELRYEVLGPQIWGFRTSDMRILDHGYERSGSRIWEV